jgi:tetratricopeptide (TPR) repeat protein
MRSLILFACLAGGLLAASPAFAANKNQTKERQAKKACLSGDYVKGVGILADLFIESNDSTFLFNQGRCYEQNVRYVEAAERFKEYLRKATNLSADEKADVDKHIADCEAAAAKGQARNALGTETSPTFPPPAVTAPPASASLPSHEYTSATSVSNLTSTPQPPLGETYGWPHTVKWVAAGVAVAALGFGVIENVRYYSKNQDYNNDPGCPSGAGCKSLADSADLAHTFEIVGYGTAAVATGAAITLWILDSPVQTSQASLGFACVPTVAGVVCNGRF